MYYERNDTALLVLSADTVSVDDDVLIKLKTAYSSCSYFADEKTQRRDHGLITSSDGLYTYHDRLIIPRPAQDMRTLLLTNYHDRLFVRRIPAFSRLIPYTPVPSTAIAASGFRRQRPTVYELPASLIEG
jgi:hypothetical protein